MDSLGSQAPFFEEGLNIPQYQWYAPLTENQGGLHNDGIVLLTITKI